ncbi:MAG TPA: class I SAM-dependent methyltransferase [Steroidobacteraceae bacterium]|nr:class I SAM-dependent methyltransferase [Steroidobacteraceae bacterium]
MTSAVAWLDRRLYPQTQRNWDDLMFRERVLARLRPDDAVLDVGAGAGIVAHMNFRHRVRCVCGVDLDPRVVDNPYLDVAAIGSAAALPFADATFDVVFCDNVLEHLPDPLRVFREIHRVLKPGGVFLAKTPNKWHYMPLIARMTPLWFHRLVNRARGRHSEDTFPTHYRANSRLALATLARGSGLQLERVELIEGRPEYLRLAWPLYLAGWLYERIVNASDRLATLRVLLIAELRRTTPAAPASAQSGT